jgi:hypothetical protein
MEVAKCTETIPLAFYRFKPSGSSLFMFSDLSEADGLDTHQYRLQTATSKKPVILRYKCPEVNLQKISILLIQKD